MDLLKNGVRCFRTRRHCTQSAAQLQNRFNRSFLGNRFNNTIVSAAKAILRRGNLAKACPERLVERGNPATPSILNYPSLLSWAGNGGCWLGSVEMAHSPLTTFENGPTYFRAAPFSGRGTRISGVGVPSLVKKRERPSFEKQTASPCRREGAASCCGDCRNAACQVSSLARSYR